MIAYAVCGRLQMKTWRCDPAVTWALLAATAGRPQVIVVPSFLVFDTRAPPLVQSVAHDSPVGPPLACTQVQHRILIQTVLLGCDSGTNEAGDATPPASPQQKRSRAGSPDGASGPATDAAEAPSPKRARVVAADALADGTDAAERGAVGTAADDAAPASPAAAAAAQAAGAAVSPQAAWPADSRQAQVTDFMGQRKPRDGDAHPAAKDCAGKAPLQRPKRTSNTANPLVRLGPEALSLEGFAPAAGPAAPASGAAALADASTAAAAARQQKRKQREPKRKSGSEAAKSQRRRSGDSAGSSGMVQHINQIKSQVLLTIS